MWGGDSFTLQNRKKPEIADCLNVCCDLSILYHYLLTIVQNPQPLGDRPVSVRSLLGTGPYKQRVSERSFICAYVGSRLHMKPFLPPPTCPWKKFPVHGKMSSTKPVPGARKVGEHCHSPCSLALLPIASYTWDYGLPPERRDPGKLSFL